MYRILFTKQARKALLKMPVDVAHSVREKLAAIAQDPFSNRSDVSPLKGRPGHRLRIGKWRVIYRVERDALEILVIKIASRGDVYK
jgi:mRNA interferase RelE/StbE